MEKKIHIFTNNCINEKIKAKLNVLIKVIAATLVSLYGEWDYLITKLPSAQ